MTYREALERLKAQWHDYDRAVEMLGYAFQAQVAGGWQGLGEKELGPSADLRRAVLRDVFAAADVDPLAVEFAPTHQALFVERRRARERRRKAENRKAGRGRTRAKRPASDGAADPARRPR